MQVRRVVTGNDASGKSLVLSDGASPRERAMVHTPGFVSSPMWKAGGTPDVRESAAEGEDGTMVTDPGGSAFWLITFPPDAVMMSSDWNPVLAGPEMAEASPGIAERMEPANPGMHRTPTLDYVTVVKGSVVLELDDGATVALHPGDTVVQQGTRHAWRNPSSEPATISVVLLGART